MELWQILMGLVALGLWTLGCYLRGYATGVEITWRRAMQLVDEIQAERPLPPLTREEVQAKIMSEPGWGNDHSGEGRR